LFHANNTLSLIFTQETTGVFPFLPKTMYDLTCSQGFFGNSKFNTKTKIILVFVQNKKVLEIQLIPWKDNHTPRKPEKKNKQKQKNTMK